MIMPNKIISINESCIYRAALLIPKIDDGISVVELYRKEKKMFDDMSDYIDVLNLLYVLGKVDLDESNGVIKNA